MLSNQYVARTRRADDLCFTLMAPALPVPYLVGVWIANLTISDDRVAHLGRNPFTDDDGCDDDEQNERHLGPGERRDRGVERETDAAGANQPQHRRLADVDVPTEYRNAGKRRQNFGTIPYAVTCAPLAPVARTASTWVSSISSIAS